MMLTAENAKVAKILNLGRGMPAGALFEQDAR
jgi:hypothetical protein